LVLVGWNEGVGAGGLEAKGEYIDE
jgi:hypothetical protein